MTATTPTGDKGSITVELIVVVPLYALLWLLANHAYMLYTGVLINVAEVRECAWQMADSQCQRRGGGCTTRGPTPEPPAIGIIGTRMQPVATGFPVLAPALRGPFGMAFTTEKRVSLPGPPALRVAAITTTSNYAAMCDERPLPPPWTPQTLFLAACNQIGRYCQ